MNSENKKKKEQEKKDKFIELFSVPIHNLKTTGKKASDKILHKDETSDSGILRKIEVSTDENEPSVFYYEVDGRVDSIEFICTCGKKVKVRLKYDPEDADKENKPNV
jgi:predicted enzyme related to lactoylglutathione lyase